MGVFAAIGNDDNYETVLDVAIELAGALNQTLYVTHVTKDRNASNSERAFRDEIRAFLEEATVPVEVDLEHLDRSGLRSGTAIGRQLLELTEDVGIEHIVIGHHSKNRLASAREGHTDFVVADQATVPVTIVSENVER
jgi:nucleotide-binding universal stress UspA family protein